MWGTAPPNYQLSFGVIIFNFYAVAASFGKPYCDTSLPVNIAGCLKGRNARARRLTRLNVILLMLLFDSRRLSHTLTFVVSLQRPAAQTAKRLLLPPQRYRSVCNGQPCGESANAPQPVRPSPWSRPAVTDAVVFMSSADSLLLPRQRQRIPPVQSGSEHLLGTPVSTPPTGRTTFQAPRSQLEAYLWFTEFLKVERSALLL